MQRENPPLQVKKQISTLGLITVLEYGTEYHCCCCCCCWRRRCTQLCGNGCSILINIKKGSVEVQLEPTVTGFHHRVGAWQAHSLFSMSPTVPMVRSPPAPCPSCLLLLSPNVVGLQRRARRLSLAQANLASQLVMDYGSCGRLCREDDHFPSSTLGTEDPIQCFRFTKQVHQDP